MDGAAGAGAGGGGAVAIPDVETSHKPILVLRSKVVVVGDPYVGKSALCQMFYSSGANYPKNYNMTVGADVLTKKVTIPDTTTQVELFMFDCGGQPMLHQRGWGTKFWENANMLMVVFDVSNRESFQACSKWVQRVQETMHKALPGALVGNKSDLRSAERAVVDEKEARALAKSLGLEYFETTSEGTVEVDAPFHYLADVYNRSYEEFVGKVAKEMY